MTFDELNIAITNFHFDYDNLKQGGHSTRITKHITIPSGYLNSNNYNVFASVYGGIQDYPYIRCYCDSYSKSTEGFDLVIINTYQGTATSTGFGYGVILYDKG